MSAERVVRQYVETFNRKDPAGFAALFAADAVLYDPVFPEPTKGRDAIRAMIEGIVRAFPNMSWQQVGAPIVAGGRVAFVVSVEGTHEGPLAMPGGDVPPTGSRWSTTRPCCGRWTRTGSSPRNARTSTRRASRRSSASSADRATGARPGRRADRHGGCDT